ncbi:MAG: hypothetical protein R3C30_14575 [Hyphomonadaceae bacterium]
MKRDDGLIELIDEIYKLVGNPTDLQNLLARIADWRGADMALLTAPPLPGCAPVPLMAYKLDFSLISGRPDMALRPELTTRAMATGRAPGVFALTELMPPQERETNEYWQAVMAPLGITSGLLALVRTPADNMRPVSLNLFRNGSSAPFDEEDVRAMEALLPHLRSALSILLDASQGVSSFEADSDFSALSTPVFCLDQTARWFVATTQQSVAAADDGLVLDDVVSKLWKAIGNGSLMPPLSRQLVTKVVDEDAQQRQNFSAAAQWLAGAFPRSLCCRRRQSNRRPPLRCGALSLPTVMSRIGDEE